MSKYTTGELAKLCNVTVRTVQYYDKREILVPSELSEGGRRLYSEDDLKKMRIICFLRELDLPIDAIKELLSEEHPEKVISLLIEKQEVVLKDEVKDKEVKLEKLQELKSSLNKVENFSVESIGDVAIFMENKKELWRVRRNLLLCGIPMSLLELGGILLLIFTGVWWPLVLVVLLMIPFGIFASKYYYSHVKYICPECHEVFRPKFKEMFWANHTPNTRKLTCPKCNHKGFCVETYGK